MFSDDLTNVQAARVTLSTVTLTDEHAALATLVVSLAEAVDNEPTNGSLARQYREALKDLAGVMRDDSDDLAHLLRTEIPDSTHCLTT